MDIFDKMDCVIIKFGCTFVKVATEGKWAVLICNKIYI